MQIPSEFLEPKNYEGTRLIVVDDEMIKKLHAEKVEILKTEKEPVLAKMEAIEPALDAFYKKLSPLEEERKKLKDEMKPLSDEYSGYVEELEKTKQKTDLIDMKINTIANDLVKDQLGEFETPLTLHTKDGKFEIEIKDELEEKIKQVREMKSKK